MPKGVRFINYFERPFRHSVNRYIDRFHPSYLIDSGIRTAFLRQSELGIWFTIHKLSQAINVYV